jgi:hypothetical protein
MLQNRFSAYYRTLLKRLRTKYLDFVSVVKLSSVSGYGIVEICVSITLTPGTRSQVTVKTRPLLVCNFANHSSFGLMKAELPIIL